jgi:hypothetical membrane protein
VWAVAPSTVGLRPRLRAVERRAALGGIVGPIGFIVAWALTGALLSDYSSSHDAISRLAAVHAPTRAAMSGGFVVFAVGVTLYAWALRAAVPGWAWLSAFMSGLATLGVALVPLGQSPSLDAVHGVFAGIGYVALAATPLLAALPLRGAGRIGWARASVLISVTSGICLAFTTVGSLHGLFQRLGLTISDAWIIATAIRISRGDLPSAFASPASDP